jgi:hypothetical protein
MRHWAEIDSDNIVQRVIVADSAEWCEANLGGVWVEAFRKGVQRFHFPGTGFRFDSERDAFISPKPFESWVLDEATCLWEAPVAYPEDGGVYTWDEEAQAWQAVEEPSA